MTVQQFWDLTDYRPTTMTLVIEALTVLTLLWWWWWWRTTSQRPSSTSSLPLPPSPGVELPLLGHALLLKGSDPRDQFREWRKRHGDVFSFKVGRQVMVVLNGYRAIRQALVTHADVFSHRPHLPLNDVLGNTGGIVVTSGPEWKALRTTSLEILREMGMGKNLLAQKVQEEIQEFVKALHAFQGRPKDLTSLTQTSISNNICSIIFGRRFDYEDEKFKTSMAKVDEFFKIAAFSGVGNILPWLRFLPGDFFLIKKRVDIFTYVRDNFIKPEIEEHVRNYNGTDADDYINAYIRDMRSEKKRHLSQYLNELNLELNILALFAAGTDTTATTILWTLAYFLHYPEIQEKCFQEVMEVIGSERMPAISDRTRMTYLEATIMEVLRHAGIVPLSVPHSVSEDVELDGYLIPKGCVVLVYLDTALRDAAGWTDPDVFKPERFISEEGRLVKPDSFIPFSTGRRVCLGESLARMELFLYLSTMIQRFHFAPPENGEMPSLHGEMGLSKSPGLFMVRAVPRNMD